jgi:hypothetical protein
MDLQHQQQESHVHCIHCLFVVGRSLIHLSETVADAAARVAAANAAAAVLTATAATTTAATAATARPVLPKHN